MVILLMGVSGAGKTTTGKQLAHQLGWQFFDGDDLHPTANIEKMRRGIALSDADRRPWLEAVRTLLEDAIKNKINAVVACSALKRSYRERLIVNPAAVKLVYLKGEPQLISRRLTRRRRHFMSRDLLTSQFDTLEEPTDAIVVDVAQSTAAIVHNIQQKLGLQPY